MLRRTCGISSFGFFSATAAASSCATKTSCSSATSASSSSSSSSSYLPYLATPKRYAAAGNLSKEELAKAWLQLSYQIQGHKIADYDPLKRQKPAVPELSPEFYGLSSTDPATEKMIARAKQLFCGSFSTEYSHLNTDGMTEWVSAQVQNKQLLPTEQKRLVLRQLLEADVLERFFNKKFGATKRFGLEGGESLIPGLKALVEQVAQSCDANRVVIGMAHRGRLQVLHHICGKPLWKIFREFHDVIIPGTQLTNKGDVKYHLGHKMAYVSPVNGKELTVECLPNPSHLEAVNPVVTGYARGMSELSAKKAEGDDATDSGSMRQSAQFAPNESNPHKAVPVLIHGDAAISGQGICHETCVFEELPSYSVGGTIHIVCNNQIGFTTDPRDSRSAHYTTALAYLNNSPVIRVNGDSPLRVVEAFKLAVRHREQFHEDVFIDLVCYRRKGHNEGDNPSFTQPNLYKQIDALPRTAELFAEDLIKSHKCITEDEVLDWQDEIESIFKKEYDRASDKTNSAKPAILPPREFPALLSLPTGVSIDELRTIGLKHLTSAEKFPHDFTPHPNVWKGAIEQRRLSYEEGKHILWASAEALALASLIREGVCVRYSGEDVQRGTWAQRHFVLHNTNPELPPGIEFCALDAMAKRKPEYGNITLANSPLSEYGVAGFEFGYSLARPDTLVLWEAQFGDFANAAQIIWDQFVSSSSTKWGQRCGLCISLPHGFDGQGPEHSSARIERFLQNCNERIYLPDGARSDHSSVNIDDALEGRNAGTNWTICYPTTPANYFHMLRRQMKRDPSHRVPLVFFFSKGGLRTIGSTIEEMGEGTRFRPVISDAATGKKTKTVVFCSGQVSHQIFAARKKMHLDDSVSILRLEQLAPFPYEHVRHELRQLGVDKNCRFVWCQEEPKNAGGWMHARYRLRKLLNQGMFGAERGVDIEYAGRDPSGSPATGYGHVHSEQLQALLNLALRGTTEPAAVAAKE